MDHYHHARSPAEGPVVHFFMFVLGKCSDVICLRGNYFFLRGALKKRLLEIRIEHIRENGKNVKSHYAAVSPSDCFFKDSLMALRSASMSTAWRGNCFFGFAGFTTASSGVSAIGSFGTVCFS